MSDTSSERREHSDRRSGPRGGRRPGDPQGYAPLVLVADDDADAASRCVVILARLRFAVAPAYSVEEAMRVMRALHPNLVVARLRDADDLRAQMAADPDVADLPFVALDEDNSAPQLMLEAIREALHRHAERGDTNA